MQVMPKSKNDNLSIIDLYCGVGGFSLGAARAGFKIAGAIDNDPITIETHKQNFPKTNHLQLNLSKVTGKTLVKKLGVKKTDITGIIGGPPCQGFSTIGKNHISDPRNDLFIQFYRLVNQVKPKFFVCENVPGILRNKYDKIRNAAQSILKDHYTFLEPITLVASDYGAPTSRTRVFFIGFQKSLGLMLCEDDFKPSQNISKIIVEYALKGLPKKINPEWQEEETGWRKIRSGPNSSFGKRLNGLIPLRVGNRDAILSLRNDRLVTGCLGTIHNKEVLQRWKKLEVGKIDPISRTIRLDPKGYCPTLRAGTAREKGGFQSLRPIHPTEDRVITTREAARLQGFPDWFIFHQTKWHSFRQIGNSVSPLLAEKILKVIHSKISTI
jgi:DNA (cytosine-5)-methyltransferase 1